MSDLAQLHEEKYKSAKAAGLMGWGGDERISKLSDMVEERYFSYEKVPSSGRLLELGCGAGNLSIVLAKKGFEVSGVDFSQTAIQWAKENAQRESQVIDFKVADVLNLSIFDDQSFDVVYDGNCLHCLLGENRQIALHEWRRILKPGGVLFISSLCGDEIHTLEESGIPYRFISTPQEIETELQSADFKILKKYFRSGTPFGHINIHAT